ncbi:MAG: PEGA domain-containing protein [Verrucomicrobia bacterium]|nr:PEGA domain-containing protein [Verrucomicrobiota bacterium]
MKTITLVGVGSLGLASAFFIVGCATDKQLLEDKSHCLTVVVNSVPTGAKVFGVKSGGIGSLIGTTPTEIRYRPTMPDLFVGTAPVEETLETTWKRKSIFFQDFSSRATFKCFVVMDGYLPYRIYEEVDKSDSGLCFQGFCGGHKEFTAQLQSKQPAVVPAGGQQAAQQSAREGKVVVSCVVQGVDVFVDGAFVGNCPATLLLKEGLHTIEVKKEGRGTFKREIRVNAGSEISIRAELGQ